MIGISMRRMSWKYASGSCEMRDGLDSAWWGFLSASLPGLPFLPLPNIGDKLSALLGNIEFSGFILSGGDDWGVFPERDQTEKLIFEYAQKKDLPIMGVCRGAQLINCLLGGKLASVSGHAARRHEVYSDGSLKREVNSYHNYGISTLAPGLMPLAADSQGHIEAFASGSGKILGIMWHPEREEAPDPADQEMFANMFFRAKK